MPSHRRANDLKNLTFRLPIALLLSAAFASSASAEDPPELASPVTEEPAPTLVSTDGYLPGEPEPDRGYLPDAPPPGFKPTPTMPGPPSPLQGGLRLMLGFQVPTGGELRNEFGERDISGTADAGLGVFLSLYDRVQIGTAFRGGVGGFDSGYEVPGTDGEPGSRHFWVGADLRVNLTTQTRVRPFVSGSLGGDRIAEVFKRGTGAYECEERGSGYYYCDEETERVFTIGYWGLSTGFGGGIQVLDIMKNASLVIEVQGLRNRYGRLTSSGFENQRLGEDARSTWQVGTLVMLQVGP